jgi:monofunctional biosynthetic peptidoglycan transglycosylase
MTHKNKSGFWGWIKKIFLILLISHLGYMIILKWLNPPFTLTQIANMTEGEGLQRDYVSYEEMGDNIKLAVISSEDQLFPEHNGFDIKSIKKAMDFNQKHPNRVRGASTISQQTAKNVFLWQHGGFFRKGLEVYFTFLIETVWGKRRILETYLNVAEMGPGIFGVQAASKAYFGKDASKLSRKEAAMIAACLPNPKKYAVRPPSRYVSKRSGKIMVQMNNLEGDPDIQSLLKD